MSRTVVCDFCKMEILPHTSDRSSRVHIISLCDPKALNEIRRDACPDCARFLAKILYERIEDIVDAGL